MKNKNGILLSALMLIPFIAGHGQQMNKPCDYFYKQLKNVPHEQLEDQKGVITFSWDKKEYQGCEINFVTYDSLLTENHSIPSFWPKGNRYLHQKGWQYNLNYDADGPGSTVFGIENGGTLCLIYKARPSYLKDKGEIVQGSKVTVTVECVVQ